MKRLLLELSKGYYVTKAGQAKIWTLGGIWPKCYQKKKKKKLFCSKSMLLFPERSDSELSSVLVISSVKARVIKRAFSEDF